MENSGRKSSRNPGLLGEITQANSTIKAKKRTLINGCGWGMGITWTNFSSLRRGAEGGRSTERFDSDSVDELNVNINDRGSEGDI